MDEWKTIVDFTLVVDANVKWHRWLGHMTFPS